MREGCLILPQNPCFRWKRLRLQCVCLAAPPSAIARITTKWRPCFQREKAPKGAFRLLMKSRIKKLFKGESFILRTGGVKKKLSTAASLQAQHPCKQTYHEVNIFQDHHNNNLETVLSINLWRLCWIYFFSPSKLIEKNDAWLRKLLFGVHTFLAKVVKSIFSLFPIPFIFPLSFFFLSSLPSCKKLYL